MKPFLSFQALAYCTGLSVNAYGGVKLSGTIRVVSKARLPLGLAALPALCFMSRWDTFSAIIQDFTGGLCLQ